MLDKRRPDLVHLPLTCENTNTPLPYLDLVNEVLEQAVAPFAPVEIPGDLAGELETGPLPDAVREAFSEQDIEFGSQATVVATECETPAGAVSSAT